MSDTAPVRLIELNLRSVDQLFNTMDPSPFDDKDLDKDAEEFMSSWAREYSRHEQISLRVHLAVWPATDPVPVIRDAIHNYFASQARNTERDLRRLMRRGRSSLAIGLSFLAVCIITARILAPTPTGFGVYIREGLTIAGWVGMWRPMEIYLYDWWPLWDLRRHFERLSTMDIEVVRAAA